MTVMAAIAPRPPKRSAVAAVAVVLTALAGCGSNGDAEPERAYTLHLRAEDASERYTYVAEDEVDIRVGDEVTFEVDNAGALIHDLQVVDPDGSVVGVAAAANPGATTSVTVFFEEPGFYRLNCLVDNHLTEHDMQVIVEVTA